MTAKYPLSEKSIKYICRWNQLEDSLSNFKNASGNIHLVLENWDRLEEVCENIPDKYNWARKLKLILADLTNKERRRDDCNFTFELSYS